MKTNAYHFITHWRVAGTAGEVSAVISDALALPHWWPAVYLSAQELQAGDEQGVGRRISLHTKGWLPYTLKWQFVVTAADAPRRLALVATGDFEGTGHWTFAQDGAFTNVTYDWRLVAEKPLLRYFSLIARPLFAANHRWAMARGEGSLERELRRRRGEMPRGQ